MVGRTIIFLVFSSIWLTLASFIIFVFNIRLLITYPVSLIFTYLSNAQLYSSKDVVEPVLARWARTLMQTTAETFKMNDDEARYLHEISTEEFIFAMCVIAITSGILFIYRYHTGQPILIFLILAWLASLLFNTLWRLFFRLLKLMTTVIWVFVGSLFVIYTLTVKSALYAIRIIEVALGLRQILSIREASVNPEWIMFKNGFVEINNSFSSSDAGATAIFTTNIDRGIRIILKMLFFM